MRDRCGNSEGRNDLVMAEPSSADFLNETCFLKGQSNGREFRMAVSNKGKQSLVREGFMYRLDHSGKDKLSWRCSTRGCPAHLKTDPSAELIVQDNDKPHTHPLDDHKFEKQMLRIFCKRKAVEDCSSRTQDIISNEMTRLNGLNLSPKNTKFLQLAMYRERKKLFPRMPRVARSGKTLTEDTKLSGHLDSVTSIPQPHIPALPTAFYTQPPPTAYQPHFDMLTDDGGAEFQHHLPHHHHQDDSSLQPLSQQLLQHHHSELPHEMHQHQLLQHQLQPVESTLPQTVFPNNHLLAGPVVMASSSDTKFTNIHQLSSSPMETTISYTDFRIHEDLLNDKVHTLTYRRALQENRARLKGATVLEVGTGTGILSHFAVHAGATRVYAVESSGRAAFADMVTKENGTGAVITVLQSKVETADIPVKVDAIICEWMGRSLLCESKLPSLVIARDRFLKQGGDVYPCTATLYLAPVTDDSLDDRFKCWKQMKTLYGVSMDSLASLARDAVTARAETRHLEAEAVLANACQVCGLDLKTVTLHDALVVKSDFDFKCYSSNSMHGFATWFTVSFPGSVTLDTSPYSLKTHWGQTVLYLKSPLCVRQDSEITGVFKMHPSTDNYKLWEFEIDFQLNRGGKCTQKWLCGD